MFCSLYYRAVKTYGQRGLNRTTSTTIRGLDASTTLRTEYGQGGELRYPATSFQNSDAASTLPPETMVLTPGIEPGSRAFQTPASTSVA